MAPQRPSGPPANKLRSDNVRRLIAQASVQREQHDALAAIATLRKVLALAPKEFGSLVNLGLELAKIGQAKEAESLYRRAIAVEPQRPEPRYNLGEMLRQANRHSEALECFESALASDPRHVKAMFGRMLTLRHLKRFEEAKTACIALLANAPDHIGALYQRLKMAQHRGDFDDCAAAHAQLVAVLPQVIPQSPLLVILANLAYIHLFAPWPPAIAQALSTRIGALLIAQHGRQALKPPRPKPAAGRRLRIGYLSPNWGNHPVGHVTRSFFARHDGAAVEVFGYSAKDRGKDRGSFNADIARSFHHHVDLAGLAPHLAAARIARDQLDVLVDVDGFMDVIGPRVMAHRPAPVQVFWLGHAGGLGLPFVDYLVADHRVVHDDEIRSYGEAVVRVPGVYHPADRHPVDAETPSRASEGLPEHGIVLCGFNNPQKIDRTVFEAWTRILKAVPGSVLWLTNHVKNGDPKPGLRNEAAAAGIDPARLVFAEHRPEKGQHLARHRCADLFLDTFVMNAATTALDALSVGLPVLTRRGSRFGERMATTFLEELGCHDLVCDSTESYVARAVALAADNQRRRSLRDRILGAIDAGRLFDSTPLARALERAYATMVDRAAKGQAPIAFDVGAA